MLCSSTEIWPLERQGVICAHIPCFRSPGHMCVLYALIIATMFNDSITTTATATTTTSTAASNATSMVANGYSIRPSKFWYIAPLTLVL